MKFKNDITSIQSWYGQQDHLINQLSFYSRMAEKYKCSPKVIIINDGNEAERDFFRDMIDTYRTSFDLVGIDVMYDVGFNSHTCRNVGVQNATTDWIWLIDVDCYEEEGIFYHSRFEAELSDDMFYIPKAKMQNPDDLSQYELLDPKGIIKYKTHPNSWIMTRECFWSSGGYDLEFQSVRQGDAEFFISLGRPGHKTWDYNLLSDDDKHRIHVMAPKRDPFYIRQESTKQSQAREIIEHVRTKNTNPYRKYRKRINNLPWEFV